MDESPQVGRVVGRRYALLAPLGGGARGGVWSARDGISGEVVAVKLLDSYSRELSATTRREIAVLRAVQLPGVVRLLDEGVDGDLTFLVMEHVPGEPFPARERPCAWRDIAAPTRELVEILARVHAAGVVHRDLKPGNVLVADGRPVVLDFGVSWGVLDDPAASPIAITGTPAYMAPEQVRSEPVTSAADLYALGVMLFEALAGRLPFHLDTAYATMVARCLDDAPSLRDAKVDAPLNVIDAIDALLQREPARRPASARDLLDLLEGRLSRQVWVGTGAAPPLDLDALRGLIEGPARFFHVPDDAAQVLMARTGGAQAQVRAELDAWVRAGFARRDGERVALDRAGVERLMQPATEVDAPASATPHERAQAHAAAAAALPRGAPGRLGHTLRSLTGAREGVSAEVLHEGCAAARRALSEGRTGAGLAALSEAWLAVLRVGERVEPAAVRALFEAWAELAVLDATPAAVDRVLYEVARAPADVPLADLDALLRASMAVRSDPSRALALATEIPCFELGALERARHGVRVAAARHGSVDVEEAIVDSLGPWAASGDPCDRAAFEGWRAWVLYRRGRYLDAAERHVAAAGLDPSPAAGLAALIAAASALIEGFAPERALVIACDAQARAARDRQPYLEARAAWLQRMARYRLGEALAPDVELVRVVAAMGGGNNHALVALTEAAIAWRSGALEVGRELAVEAHGVWSAMGRAWAPCMARALALACGDVARAGEIEALAGEALRCPVAGVGIQVLALLAGREAAVATQAGPHVDRLSEQVAGAHWHQRVAVLSVYESRRVLYDAARALRPPGDDDARR